MKITKVAALLTMALVLPGCVIHVGAQSANVHLQESLSLNASELTSLEVESGSGVLIIAGKEGATEISVQADIETTKKRNYELTLHKVGSKAVLVAKHHSSSGFWNGNSPQINLTVTVPQHLALNIDDGSGDIKITDINNAVDIEDGSGDIIVKNVQGNLRVDDGSGELQVTNISGDVAIDDGSGDTWVADIAGSVEVEDGSGDMTLHNIGGMITIDDGSGDIEVRDAGGLTITDSGSGGLNIKAVKGEFNIDS